MRRGSVKFPGVHRTEAPLAGGRYAIYYYRSRKGGEQLIKFEGDTLRQGRAAEAAGATAIIASVASPRKGNGSKPRTVKDLVTLYRAAPDGFLGLREGSTRKQWLPWLDKIVDEFGDLPVCGATIWIGKAVNQDWKEQSKQNDD